MSKSKFSASSIAVSSIFEIHLVNGAQFLNDIYGNSNIKIRF